MRTPSWQNVRNRLEILRAEPAAGIGRALEELARCQNDAPISSEADAATAFELGLTCLGIDLDHDEPGEILIRNALAWLER